MNTLPDGSWGPRWDAGRLVNWTAFRVGRMKHWRAELEHNGRALRLVVGRGPGGWRYGVEVFEAGALLTAATTTEPTAPQAKAWAAGFAAGLTERLNAAPS